MEFKTYESVERQLAERYFKYSNISDYSLAAIGTFKGTDGEYVHDNGRTVFEVKVRGFGREKFQRFILETRKAVELLRYHKQGIRVTYLNFFKEDIGGYSVVEFDMSARFDYWLSKGKTLNDVSKTINLPKNTASSKGQFVKKLCIMLKPSPGADKITYID